MTGKFQPKGSIYEVSFGYNTNLGGYTTLISDIPKLYEIILFKFNTKRM